MSRDGPGAARSGAELRPAGAIVGGLVPGKDRPRQALLAENDMPPDSSTILLVDDEESIQKLLAFPLEREGYRVLQARDGEEALNRFASEHVDLVVLDIMLPKLDGLEVCKRLRAESEIGRASCRGRV